MSPLVGATRALRRWATLCAKHLRLRRQDPRTYHQRYRAADLSRGNNKKCRSATGASVALGAAQPPVPTILAELQPPRRPSLPRQDAQVAPEPVADPHCEPGG